VKTFKIKIIVMRTVAILSYFFGGVMANEYLFTEFIFMFAQTGVLNFNSLLLWSSYKNDINFPFQVALMSLLILIYFTIYFIIIYNLLSRGYYKAAQRYRISFWVLKNISWVSSSNKWNIFQYKKTNFACACNVSFVI